MSRSKRLSAPITEAAPARTAPPWLRPLLAMLVYALATVAVRLGLGAGLRALLSAWNVNAETVSRAPGWARALYVWQGSLVTLAVCTVSVALALFAFRAQLPVPKLRPTAVGWLVGTGAALGSAALFLLTDSLRSEWVLPRLSPGLALLWLLSLLTALSEELFTKGVLLESVKRSWGTALAALAFFLTHGGTSGTVISGVNVALMGLAFALIYLRFGLWADVALRWGWSFATVFLLGQGGGSWSVWRLYGVSETLLTGGDAGFVYGLWLTLLLVAVPSVIFLPRKKRAYATGAP